MPEISTIALIVIAGAGLYYLTAPRPIARKTVVLNDPSDFSGIPITLFDPYHPPKPDSENWKYNHDRS